MLLLEFGIGVLLLCNGGRYFHRSITILATEQQRYRAVLLVSSGLRLLVRIRPAYNLFLAVSAPTAAQHRSHCSITGGGGFDRLGLHSAR